MASEKSDKWIFAAGAIIIGLLLLGVYITAINTQPHMESIDIPIPIGVIEIPGNATHWELKIISSSADYNDTKSYLRQDGVTVQGYDQLLQHGRHNCSNPNMEWHDIDESQHINPGDMIYIRKGDLPTGDYQFIMIKEGSNIIERTLTL